MAASKETLQAASSISTTADEGWKDRYERERINLNNAHIRIGTRRTNILFDQAQRKIELNPSGDGDSQPVVITKDRVLIPEDKELVVNSPRQLFVSPNLTLNPNSIGASTIMTPIPGLINKTDQSTGLLTSLLSLLGG